MYEATTLKELEVEFRRSVDEYLLSCEEYGRDVQQPCIILELVRCCIEKLMCMPRKLPTCITNIEA